MRRQLFAKKSLSMLMDEMAGEHRLRRVLGPVTLTSLGVGAVIGAGIFVADSFLASMSAKLRVAHHQKLTGLAATLTASQQLVLV
jgi:APA family basic amino acid/polyamine antiporter